MLCNNQHAETYFAHEAMFSHMQSGGESRKTAHPSKEDGAVDEQGRGKRMQGA